MTTSRSGYDLTPLSPQRREELARDLTPEERQVILDHGTERPFCGTLLNNKDAGVYACRLCGLPLFRSDEKFESGTGWPSFTTPFAPAHTRSIADAAWDKRGGGRGWPSFTTPFDPEHIRSIEDRSYGMVRVEIRCARCDGHLG